MEFLESDEFELVTRINDNPEEFYPILLEKAKKMEDLIKEELNKRNEEKMYIFTHVIE